MVLGGGEVGIGEIHGLFPLGILAVAGGDEIDLTGIEGGGQGIELHVLHLQLDAETVGDLLGNLLVDADDVAVAILGFEGHELGVGTPNDLARVLNLCQVVLLLAAHQQQAEHEHRAQGGD